MNDLSYTSLINNTLEMYLQGEYSKAYDFITENSSKVNGNLAQIYNFRYCIAIKAGFNELSLQIMKEAIVDKGFWYSYEYLNNDEDLMPLHDNELFKELIQICRNRQAEAIISTKPHMKLFETTLDTKGKRSLIMALHGNQENIEITEQYWNTNCTRGLLLGLVQSSSIDFSDAYIWNDVEKGAIEIQQHYNHIKDIYDIDITNVIIGGFSAGAATALYSVINGYVPAKGMILFGPWVPDIKKWEKQLDQLKEKKVKSYIVCGDRDEECYECTMQLVETLKEKEIEYEFIIIKGLKHQYPDDFDTVLESALGFINKS
ncbi:MAG: phospholipase/Carboxylesterase family protein [Clostridia bacterium]|jgi:predicted esterase|nr:phospholipase/Carboxylesterase family protein [Clostridia bacterium]